MHKIDLKINNINGYKGGNVARPRSIWDIECFDKNGKLKWKSRDTNLVTNEGLDSLLSVYFASGTQLTSWYVVIFESNTTPLATHTYAVPGYTESTAYDEADRPGWTPGSVSSQSVDNSASKASFTINATKTIYGAALVGGGAAPETKGNTAGGGTLYCSSLFAASRSVVDDDVLKVTVTLTTADA